MVAISSLTTHVRYCLIEQTRRHIINTVARSMFCLGVGSISLNLRATIVSLETMCHLLGMY